MIARSAVLAAGDALLPIARDGDRPVFNEAWEAQAFAMVVALHEAKLFSWSEWTSALSREIAAASPANDREAGDSYYRHWLQALESLVVEKGAASRAALALRKAAWVRAAGATPHGRPILLANDPQAAPNGEGRKSHWERVYETRADTEVSWFEADPAPSLEALARVGATRRSAVIDVGGGASRLVDRLIHDGYEDVTVLDISAAAIAAARARLGEASKKAHWLVADATAWTSGKSYDVWHDRAAFHFLIDPADEAAYVGRLRRPCERAATRSSRLSRPTGRNDAAAFPSRGMTARASPPHSATTSRLWRRCGMTMSRRQAPYSASSSASSGGLERRRRAIPGIQPFQSLTAPLPFRPRVRAASGDNSGCFVWAASSSQPPMGSVALPFASIRRRMRRLRFNGARKAVKTPFQSLPFLHFFGVITLHGPKVPR